jgi:precorrin-8X/cobalt-precorrin-8 methylmutase
MPQSALSPTADPAGIERESFAIIDYEIVEPRPFSGRQWQVARRLLHTSADYELLGHIRFHPDAIDAGLAALRAGATVVTDTRMALEGIPARRREALGFRVECSMMNKDVIEKATRQGCTRAKLVMDQAISLAGPLIFAIGNAPTALLRLLELIQSGATAPALIVGMPVGFVNAAQSKDLLIHQSAIPYISIEGRKGGSALAAATVNALAEMLLEEQRGS